MGKWPELAYHWPSDSEITAADAIKKREKDNRTGDIWCHADCYKSTPKKGTELWARKGPWRPHFWIGNGSFTKNMDCEYDKVKSLNSESHRYSQIYHDLIRWLTSSGQLEEWKINEVSESGNKDCDLEILHDIRGKIQRERTVVLIVDRNRKRLSQEPNIIFIDISRWPDSHIQDFKKHGKRKFVELWDELDNKMPIVASPSKQKGSNVNFISKEDQEKIREENINHDITTLKITAREYQKLRSINDFLSKINDKLKRREIRNIRDYAPKLFGEKISQMMRIRNYIKNQVEKINMKDILEKELTTASEVFSKNPKMSYTNDYVNLLRYELIKLRPEEATFGNYHSIKTNFDEVSDLSKLIDYAHSLLFDQSNTLFEHVKRRNVYFDTKRLDTRLDTKVGFRLRTKQLIDPSLFSWMRSEGIFFNALFGLSND